MRLLFLAFVVLPIVEMTILIKVGSIIGALNTIGLVLLTAVVGAAMLRQQGLATLMRANERLNSGELPAREVAEGILLAVGGALLITPGFVTDFAGLLCLMPFTRRWLATRVLRRIVVINTRQGFGASSGQNPFSEVHEEIIIEGEFRRDEDTDASRHERLDGKR